MNLKKNPTKTEFNAFLKFDDQFSLTVIDEPGFASGLWFMNRYHFRHVDLSFGKFREHLAKLEPGLYGLNKSLPVRKSPTPFKWPTFSVDPENSFQPLRVLTIANLPLWVERLGTPHVVTEFGMSALSVLAVKFSLGQTLIGKFSPRMTQNIAVWRFNDVITGVSTLNLLNVKAQHLDPQVIALDDLR